MVNKHTLNLTSRDLLKKIGKQKTRGSTEIKRPFLAKAMPLMRCSTSRMAT